MYQKYGGISWEMENTLALVEKKLQWRLLIAECVEYNNEIESSNTRDL